MQNISILIQLFGGILFLFFVINYIKLINQLTKSN